MVIIQLFEKQILPNFLSLVNYGFVNFINLIIVLKHFIEIQLFEKQILPNFLSLVNYGFVNFINLIIVLKHFIEYIISS